jgi:hypothetical protein
MRQPIKDRMLQIKTAYNLGLKATASHKMIVYDDFGFAVKTANELRPGDLVPMANRAPEGDLAGNIEVPKTVQKVKPCISFKIFPDGTISLTESPLRLPSELAISPPSWVLRIRRDQRREQHHAVIRPSRRQIDRGCQALHQDRFRAD